jgi:hypothetical protein
MLRQVSAVVAITLLGALAASHAHAELVTLRVAGWNMESGESDDQHLKAQIGEKEGIDLWGFSEVRDLAAAEAFAEGAETGENADYELILGNTGGSDRLAIVYNTNRLELIGTEELDEQIFSNHRVPLVAHFRGKASGLEFKFMVNHLARGNAQARLSQARFLNDWVRSEPVPVMALGDYNFDYHVEFGDQGERDAGFDAMLKGNAWIWLKPERLVKTQADDQFMSVLDFVFVANPPAGVTGVSAILDQAGDAPATDLDFGDSQRDTDHRPVAAVFTVGTETPPVEILLASDEGEAAGSDRDAILERIRALQAELSELESLVADQQ